LDENLIAGTYGGTISLSTDNGISWVETAGTYSDINAFVTSDLYLFASTSSVGVLRSSNNGISWSFVNNGLSAYVYSLLVSGSNIFAGTNYSVFLSTDSGANWITANTGIENNSIKTMAASGENIFAGTFGQGVYRSSNNGSSWISVNTGLTNPYIQSLVSSDSNLFAGTIDGLFLSTNNGANWVPVNNGLPDTSIKCMIISQSNIFIGTESGIFLSTNYGTSWIDVSDRLINKNIVSLAISSNYLYAGNYSGGIWIRPLSEMITSVETPSSFLPLILQLNQNYPNPFNPSTKISWQSPVSSHQTLKIYDVLGNEVATLVNEYRNAGNYEVDFNASKLASGIYFYRLQAGSYIQTKKMILLK